MLRIYNSSVIELMDNGGGEPDKEIERYDVIGDNLGNAGI
jgi:hypothetical protein